MLKIKILRRRLGNRRVGTVGTANRATDAVSPLREIQTVPANAPDAVRLHPFNQGRVHAALLDKVFHQKADFVLRERGNHSRVHAETLVQAADDVVLPAAFPRAEAARGTNPALAGIQPQHELVLQAFTCECTPHSLARSPTSLAGRSFLVHEHLVLVLQALTCECTPHITEPPLRLRRFPLR